MKLATKIWLVVGITWGIGMGASAFQMYRSHAMSAGYDDLFEHEVYLQDLARQMQVAFQRQVQEWKDILLRGSDPAALKKYSEAFEKQQNKVKTMSQALKTEAPDPQIRDTAEKFAQAHADMGLKYEAALQTFIRGCGQNTREVDAMVKGQDRAPTALVDHLVEQVRRRTDTTRSAFRQSLGTQLWIVGTFLLLAFGGVGIGSAIAIARVVGGLRQTVHDLSETAEQVASAAAQISTSSQSLAQGASQQAASLEETSASTEEIGSMTRRNTENSRSSAELVSSSVHQFEQSNELLQQTVSAMGEIGASSEKIAKFIKVIEEIAFQTNILALNAAVESARAGEAGLGFAVVADEVRTLARRCTEAAKDTEQLIGESMAKSKEGKSRVDLTAQAILTLSGQSTKIRNLTDQVNQGSQEQAHGIQQIAKAITQMEQVTQITAANAEESAAAAEQLSAQSTTMMNIARDLRQLVDGRQPIATTA